MGNSKNTKQKNETRFLSGEWKRSFSIMLLALLLSFTQNVKAQAPDWEWAKGIGGNSYGNTVITDAAGNILVAGSFDSPTVTFGTTTLINSGGADIFIVKYNSSGNVLWAKKAAGSGTEVCYNVTTDVSNNIFITGQFQSADLTFGTTVLSSVGTYDIFIAKFDSNGNALWARGAGGAAYDYGTSVAADLNGNVFMTGYFLSPTITFGATTLTNKKIKFHDMFIAKYDASGNVLWVKKEGGNGDDYSKSVATDAAGNVFITGYFDSKSITIGTTTLTHLKGYELFFVKYSAGGNVIWVKSSGSTGKGYGNSIVTDGNGNVFITGSFYSSAITFGTITLTNTDSLSLDVFVVKYDDNGNALWANAAGGAKHDACKSIATDASGNVVMIGDFNSPLVTFGATTLTNADNYGSSSDIFIVKYDASGNVLWAKSIRGSYNENAGDIASDINANVFVTGGFTSPSITFGTITLPINGYYSKFIAKIPSNITDPCTTITCTINPKIFAANIENVSNASCNDGKIKVSLNGTFQFFPVLELYNMSNVLVQSVALPLGTTFYRFKNLEAGTYTVKVYDNKCCETDLIAHVKCPPPTTGISTSDINATSVQFNWDVVNCAIGYRIHYREQGDTIWITTGVNTNVGLKTVTGLMPSTNYEWEIATKCVGFPAFDKFEDSPLQFFSTPALRIGETVTVASAFDISLYPNPATHTVTVVFENNTTTAQLKVLNTIGQVVIEKQLQGANGSYEELLDVSKLNTGIYFLLIETSNGYSHSRLVKN